MQEDVTLQHCQALGAQYSILTTLVLWSRVFEEFAL